MLKYNVCYGDLLFGENQVALKKKNVVIVSMSCFSYLSSAAIHTGKYHGEYIRILFRI